MAELDPEAMSFDHEEAARCKAALFRISDKALKLCSVINGKASRVSDVADHVAASTENARLAAADGKAAALKAMNRPRHRPSISVGEDNPND